MDVVKLCYLIKMKGRFIMKKLFKVLTCLICALVLCVSTACKPEEKPEEPKEVDYKLGMGVTVNMASSKEKQAQVDATVAAVLLDKDGKIISCRLDAVQNKATLAEGVYTVTNLKTKMELGDDYNMAKYGKDMDMNGDGIVKEWYEQAKAFENYVVGKTAEEVKNIKTAANAHGYQMATDKALLDAGCTIQITDFISAVYKACVDEQGQSFKGKETAKYTLGVAATSFADTSSANVTEEKAGAINMYSDFAATVVEDGKIVACLNDAIQPKITFDATGVTETSFVDTKRCLKEDYNMAKYGKDMDMNGDGIVKEWYLQSAEFSKYVLGKTAEEVKNIKTAPNAHNYQMATDKVLLDAGCTIQISDIKAVVAKAVANAR